MTTTHTRSLRERLQSLEPPTIAVVGNCNVDFVFKLSALPTIGHRVEGCEFKMRVGGGAINTAKTVHHLGGSASIVARVGMDALGDMILRDLLSEGLDSELIISDKSAATGSALVILSDGGDRAIGVVPGANARLRPEDIEAARGLISRSDAVVVRSTIPPATAECALRIAHACGVTSILALTTSTFARLRSARLANVVILSSSDAYRLLRTRIATVEDIDGHAMTNMLGCTRCIVTFGSKGACFVSKETKISVAGRRVGCVDTTGAGDVLCGAFAHFSASGLPIRTALSLANTVASEFISRPAQESRFPTLTELEQLVAEWTSTPRSEV